MLRVRDKGACRVTLVLLDSRVAKKIARSLLSTAVIVLVGVFSACRTAPSVTAEDPGAGLPPDLDAFVSIDVRQNRDMLGVFAGAYGLDADELAPALNRTDRLTIGVSTAAADSETRTAAARTPTAFVVLTGTFPRTALSFSLRRSSAWTRRTDGSHGVRYESADGVTVAVPDRRTVLVSNAEFDRLAEAWSERSPGPSLPAEVVDGATAGFVLFARSPDLTGIGAVAPPVSSARIVVASRTDRVADAETETETETESRGPMRSFSISIALRGESDARAFVVVMRLAIPFIATDAGFPLAVAMRGFDVRRTGAEVVITTPEIDATQAFRLTETLGRYAGFAAR